MSCVCGGVTEIFEFLHRDQSGNFVVSLDRILCAEVSEIESVLCIFFALHYLIHPLTFSNKSSVEIQRSN